MKIVNFIGSPRKQGNSGIISQKLKEELIDIYPNSSYDIIWAYDLNIKPCISCGYCDKKGTCYINDDMNKVYSLVEESDLINFVTPIYFGSLTGQLKILIDRFQPFYASKYILDNPRLPENNNKKVSLIVVAGMSKKRFFENAKEIIDVFCINLNIPLTGSLFFTEVDYAGEILKNREYMDNKVSELAQLLTDQ